MPLDGSAKPHSPWNVQAGWIHRRFRLKLFPWSALADASAAKFVIVSQPIHVSTTATAICADERLAAPSRCLPGFRPALCRGFVRRLHCADHRLSPSEVSVRLAVLRSAFPTMPTQPKSRCMSEPSTIQESSSRDITTAPRNGSAGFAAASTCLTVIRKSDGSSLRRRFSLALEHGADGSAHGGGIAAR